MPSDTHEETREIPLHQTFRRPQLDSRVGDTPGAAAVLIFAYVQVLGSAGCGPQTCPHSRTREAGSLLIVRGAPVVSIRCIGMSFSRPNDDSRTPLCHLRLGPF